MRLMYKTFVTAAMACLLLLASACDSSKESQATANKPEDLVNLLYQAMDDGNAEQVMALFSLSDIDEAQKGKVQEFLNKRIPAAIALLKRNGGLDKIEIVSSKISSTNKRATVEVKVFTMNGDYATETLSLKQEADGWKVVDFE